MIYLQGVAGNSRLVRRLETERLGPPGLYYYGRRVQ